MRKYFSFFMVVIFLFNTFPAFSSEAEVHQKTVLKQLIQEALGKNPRVQVARQEWKAALEKIPQVKSLPDPMLSYAHFGRSIETRLGPQRNKLSLSQRFPFFGKLSLKGKIAAQQAAILEEQYHQVRADVILDVKESFFSLYWFDEAVRISSEEKEVLRHLARVARKKYESGTAGQQDILKVQLENSQVTDRILTLKQGRRAAVAQLNALLNRPFESDLAEVEEQKLPPLEMDIAALYQLAETENPEQKRVRQIIGKNELQMKLAKKNYYPDFNIMLDYIDIGGGTTALAKDGQNAWMAAIGINIPLWRKKLKAAEAEAAIRLKSSHRSNDDVKNDTIAKINVLYYEIKTYEEQVKLYRFSLLPQAEQSLKASEIGYVAGKVDFLSMLDSQRMILKLKTGFAKLLADLGRSNSRLERIVGSDLFNQQSPAADHQLTIYSQPSTIDD